SVYFLYSFSCFFFLMFRRPPRFTLFPTRRSSDLQPALDHAVDGHLGLALDDRAARVGHVVEDRAHAAEHLVVAQRVDLRPHGRRSEEHTSELQSRSDLVCRLLLEKKKNTRKTN